MTSRRSAAASVMVTGVGGGAVGYEVLQALRHAETNYHITAVDASPQSLGLVDADAGELVPFASAGGYLESILTTCRRHSVEAIIPGSEAELLVLSARRETLADHGLLLVANKPSVLSVGLDKAATTEALSKAGFDIPRTTLAHDAASLSAVDWFPCVVKPASGGSGSNLVFIARDPKELAFFSNYVQGCGYLPAIQEYLGSAESEYTVGVLNTLTGTLVGSLAMRRDLRRGLSLKSRVRSNDGSGMWLSLSSGVSQGRIEQVEQVQRACEAMAIALGSSGPLNIQLRLVQGRVVPFEINPRFSGTCCLRAMAGFNEPDILLRHHLLGEAIAPPSYQSGWALRGLANRFIPDDNPAT